MKFIVSSTYLLKQLQVLGGVINNSNTLPILDNFLFELDNSKLTVSASDLETTMSSTLDVESDSVGSVAIPARLLLDTLKTFPEQPLTFVIEDNNTSNDTTEQAINAEKWLVTTLPNAKVDEANQGQGIEGIILNGNNCSLKKREIAMQDEDCNTEIRDRIKQLLVQQIESNLQKKKLNER